MKPFKLFPKISDLKPNMLKCDDAGIGSLECVTVNESITTEAIKILGVYKFFLESVKSIPNLGNVLNLWGMRNITVEG